MPTTHHKAKRRPGRDPEATDTTVTEMHAEAPQEEVPAAPHAESIAEPTAEPKLEANAEPKVEISFPGSEILRAKMPKPFDLAEQVATEWVKDGDFADLKLGNPLADSLAVEGLRKAKEVEKKIIASGVIEKVAMQALTFGMKAQQEIQSIRDQVKSKLNKK